MSLSADPAQIARVVEQTRPDIIHIGAAVELFSVRDTQALKAAFPDVRIMRSIPITDEASIECANDYRGVADFLLLDSHEPGDRQIGGLGRTHDWSVGAGIPADTAPDKRAKRFCDITLKSRRPIQLAGFRVDRLHEIDVLDEWPYVLDLRVRTIVNNAGGRRSSVDRAKRFVSSDHERGSVSMIIFTAAKQAGGIFGEWQWVKPAASAGRQRQTGKFR